jgi:hypothetical protein
MKCEPGRIAGGVWEAVLTAAEVPVAEAPVAEAPVVEAMHGGRAVEGVTVAPLGEGRHAVRVPIPAWVVNEGVQTILVQAGGTRLAVITLVAGEPLDEDLLAEVSLLRAELDLLKRAFQRHLRES